MAYRNVITLLVYGLSFVGAICSCKKDAPPEASIYTFDLTKNPVVDIPVRFFLYDNDGERDFIDTTVYSDSHGAANLVLQHDCFLTVWVEYVSAGGTFQFIETEADFITNQHYTDTLILNL